MGGDETVKLALDGATETDTTGVIVMVDFADTVESAALVALTVTVCGDVRVEGTVY